MLRHNNTSTLLCEEQSKFILDRISTVEKHFGELCGAFAEITRKLARLRDKSDELAHVTQDYSGSEKYNKSLATGLSSLSKAITLIGDFQDLEVKRLENRIVSELSQYEIVCKHCKDSVKDAIVVRDKELAKRKQLDQARARNNRGKKTAKDAELMKSNLEVTKSLKEMEEIVSKFEKQKLLDLKNLLMDFVMIELKFHSNAIEVLSATYQDISDIDENRDYQGVHKELKRQNRQFKKYLQQDELSERYFLQRIKSQSMGALSSMFAATGSSGGGRRNKSLSSNSLNSSQEQEEDASVPPKDPLQILASGSKHKGGSSGGGVGKRGKSLRRSTDSLDSPKRDLSEESNTTTDDSDSDTETDSATDDSVEKPSQKKQQQQAKPTKVDPKFTIIKLKDYNN